MEKKKLTKKLRLKIYKRLLTETEDVLKTGMYYIGLCGLIDTIIDELGLDWKYECDPYTRYDSRPCLILYPELYNQVDENQAAMGGTYYWPTDYKGWKKRKKVVENAIKELS